MAEQQRGNACGRPRAAAAAAAHPTRAGLHLSSRRRLASAITVVVLQLLRPCSSSYDHGHHDKWEVVHEQTPRALGSSTSPSIRYGHSMNANGGDILMTHGYFFDRETGNATWMSDTWAMQSMPPHKWRRLVAGVPQDQAHASYSKGGMPVAPCGRFGHATAVLGGYMYLYGGHDGGMSRHGRQNYEPG